MVSGGNGLAGAGHYVIIIFTHRRYPARGLLNDATQNHSSSRSIVRNYYKNYHLDLFVRRIDLLYTMHDSHENIMINKKNDGISTRFFFYLWI